MGRCCTGVVNLKIAVQLAAKLVAQPVSKTAAHNQGDKKWQLQEDILCRVLQPQRYYQQPA
jgi:hypothetical protein